MMTDTVSFLKILWTILVLGSAFSAVAENNNESGGAAATFKTGTRMVVVAVIARDEQGQIVSGLKAEDFAVNEQVEGSSRLTQKIASFRIVDPASWTASSAAWLPKRVSACNRKSPMVTHYELAYYPTKETRADGFHRIYVDVRKPGVALSYRHGYFAVVDSPGPDAQANRKRADPELMQIACDTASPVDSIPMWAQVIKPDADRLTDFAVVSEGSMLSFTPVANSDPRLALNFAACVFDREGTPINYMEHSVKQNLTAGDQKKVRELGYAHRMDIDLPAGVSWLRFVVRDQQSGRFGTYDLPYVPYNSLAAVESGGKRKPSKYSFGSLTPSPNTFCGEVHDIPYLTPSLPDFARLQAPIGIVYTPFLDVPDHVFTKGIPGVTASHQYFAIDYYGTFWIDDAPGDYRFRVVSDDGTKLYIDDRLIADNDGTHVASEVQGHIQLQSGEHRIRVAYHQGPPMNVALQLFIAPPGKGFRIFDLRNYASPEKKELPGRVKLKAPSR